MIMAEKGRFTAELFRSVLSSKIKEHLQKKGFSSSTSSASREVIRLPDTANNEKMSRISSGSVATEKDNNSSESDYEVLPTCGAKTRKTTKKITAK